MRISKEWLSQLKETARFFLTVRFEQIPSGLKLFSSVSTVVGLIHIKSNLLFIILRT